MIAYPSINPVIFSIGPLHLRWFSIGPLYVRWYGLMYVVAFAITREAVGEPLLLAALRATQGFSRWRWRRRAERALGPPRVDRARKDGDVWLKPDWDAVATIEVLGRYFRVAGIEEEETEGRVVFVYRLVPSADYEIVRRLVRYEGTIDAEEPSDTRSPFH